MIRRPPRSTLFPTRRSSDLVNRTKDGLVDVPRCWHVLVSGRPDRKSTRLNSSHLVISYAVFCLKKKKKTKKHNDTIKEKIHTYNTMPNNDAYTLMHIVCDQL